MPRFLLSPTPPHRRSVVFRPGEGEGATSPPSGPACICRRGGAPALEVAPSLPSLPRALLHALSPRTAGPFPRRSSGPSRGAAGAGAAWPPCSRGVCGGEEPPRLCCWRRPVSGDSSGLPRRAPRPGAQRLRGRARAGGSPAGRGNAAPR